LKGIPKENHVGHIQIHQLIMLAKEHKEIVKGDKTKKFSPL